MWTHISLSQSLVLPRDPLLHVHLGSCFQGGLPSQQSPPSCPKTLELAIFPHLPALLLDFSLIMGALSWGDPFLLEPLFFWPNRNPLSTHLCLPGLPSRPGCPQRPTAQLGSLCSHHPTHPCCASGDSWGFSGEAASRG